MKLPALMGLIALAMTAVIAATFFIEERPVELVMGDDGVERPELRSRGMDHPGFPGMLIGGSGADRAEPVLGLAFVFGALQIAFFIGCLAFGLRRNGRVGRVGIFILAGAGLYLLTYVGMFFTYRGYIGGGPMNFFGAMPPPTAWMLYGLWPAPLVFMLLFVLGFNRFVWDEESERAFQQIVAEKRAEEGRS
jgi:hypothetical protein